MIRPTSPDGKPAARRDAKGARRRREILDVAAVIFHEKGYDATSTKDIADAAGLLKGSLYYYVETKEDFLFEIIKENYEGAIATLDRVRRFEGTALERLARLIGEHFRYFVENLVTTTVFFREFRALSPERQAIIAAEGDEYLDYVRELLSEGQRDGSISAEVDIRVTSVGIVGMVNSAWLWYHPDGSRSSDEIAAEFVKVIISGIASDACIADFGSVSALRGQIAGFSLAPAADDNSTETGPGAEEPTPAAKPPPKRRAAKRGASKRTNRT